VKIPVEFIDVNPGDWVNVKGHRVPQEVLSFSSQVTITEDHQFKSLPSVWLRTQKGKVSWAWASEITGKIDGPGGEK